MPKLAKKQEISPDEAVRLASNVDVKKHTDRILKLMSEMWDLRSDIKSEYDQAANDGIDRKVLKMVIKVLKTPIPEEEQAMANIYLEKLGQLPLFRELA